MPFKKTDWLNVENRSLNLLAGSLCLVMCVLASGHVLGADKEVEKRSSFMFYRGRGIYLFAGDSGLMIQGGSAGMGAGAGTPFVPGVYFNLSVLSLEWYRWKALYLEPFSLTAGLALPLTPAQIGRDRLYHYSVWLDIEYSYAPYIRELTGSDTWGKSRRWRAEVTWCFSRRLRWCVSLWGGYRSVFIPDVTHSKSFAGGISGGLVNAMGPVYLKSVKKSDHE